MEEFDVVSNGGLVVRDLIGCCEGLQFSTWRFAISF